MNKKSQLVVKSKEAGMNFLAKDTANYAYKKLFRYHRGVCRLAEKFFCIFGNDSYATDERSRNVAQAVRKAALKKGLKVSDVEASKNGYSWAVGQGLWSCRRNSLI